MSVCIWGRLMPMTPTTTPYICTTRNPQFSVFPKALGGLIPADRMDQGRSTERGAVNGPSGEVGVRVRGRLHGLCYLTPEGCVKVSQPSDATPP